MWIVYKTNQTKITHLYHRSNSEISHVNCWIVNGNNVYNGLRIRHYYLTHSFSCWILAAFRTWPWFTWPVWWGGAWWWPCPPTWGTCWTGTCCCTGTCWTGTWCCCTGICWTGTCCWTCICCCCCTGTCWYCTCCCKLFKINNNRFSNMVNTYIFKLTYCCGLTPGGKWFGCTCWYCCWGGGGCCWCWGGACCYI